MPNLLDLPIFSRIRRNHGLEHATLTTLAGRFPRRPLAGYSDPGGFWIVGNVETEALADAATDGARTPAQRRAQPGRAPQLRHQFRRGRAVRWGGRRAGHAGQRPAHPGQTGAPAVGCCPGHPGADRRPTPGADAPGARHHLVASRATWPSPRCCASRRASWLSTV